MSQRSHLHTRTFVATLVATLAALAVGAFFVGPALVASEAGTEAGALTLRLSGWVAFALLLSAGVTWWTSRWLGESLTRLRELIGQSPKALSAEGVDEPALRPLATAVRRLSGDLNDALRRLADERARLLAVLEGMEDAVVATNDEGMVTLANSEARLLLGGKGSPVGQLLLDVIRAPALHDLADRVANGEHDTAQLDLPGPPERHLLVRGAPQRNGGAVLVLQDTTRRRQLEQMRREFVANVSHELRTPVSVIRANAETLLDGAISDPEFARGFLEALVRNADRLSALVSDLLDLSRVESGQYPIERRRMTPQSAVQSVVESLGQTAINAGLDLRTQIPPSIETYADPKAVEQVLINLIHNAIKHSPDQGLISVIATPEDDTVRIAVADQGPGIPVPLRARIFERFYRVDKGRAREVGGTGLGLAIVRTLVSAMGGTVGVGDAPDGSGGAEFWFTLPRFRSVFEDEAGRSYVRMAVTPQAADSSVDFELDSGVQELRRRILLMAGRVEEMIAHAARAVVQRDLELARKTIRADRNVNRDEIETDELCLRLLERQDMGSADLRFITRASKMVTDLERIADLAVNICERTERLQGTPRMAAGGEIPRMAGLVQSMVRDVIDAFVGRDPRRAHAVIARDDEVDALYHDVSREVMALMTSGKEWVEPGIHVQAVAKFLERMADHATNLAEQVVFMVRGDEIRHPGKLGAIEAAQRAVHLTDDPDNPYEPSPPAEQSSATSAQVEVIE
ncbi:MAG: phosphate signaling complex protein PhoU [Myxococcales bacterium]|nr:phosphate signaling complex protein PhoU [Myxococcales bacterium]